MSVNQQKAINKLEGPCLVRAGAGTGKTYTIVKKISNLINSSFCDSSEILCLTFSNEATNHLRHEVEKELKKSIDITIKTFHGFCAEILKDKGNLLKISSDFEILQPDDAKVVFHKYFEVTPYNSDRYVKTISTAKDFGIDIVDIEKFIERFRKDNIDLPNLDDYAIQLETELKLLHLSPQGTKDEKQALKDRKKIISEFLKNYEYYVKYNEFISAWKKYDKYKKEHNYLDFSDLNFLVLKLFDSFGSKDIAKKYKYIIVDEFQDTNKMQFDLIEQLAIGHKNITIVGDPNQSIYGFRGSFKESFNLFRERFEVTDDSIISLDKSRRSTNKILKISYELIKNNYENKDDCLFIENFEGKEGHKVKVIELKNANEEARKVSELVEEEIEKKTPLKEICVLYRTHKQGKLIVQALESKNIPIISAGKTDLLQKPEIKTVTAYLSILSNLSNRTGTGEQSWWQLFHYQNALSPQDTIKIGRYLKKNRENDISIDYATLLKLDHLDISEDGKKIVHRIISKLKEIKTSSNKPLPELILDIYEITGLNRAFSHSRSVRNVEGLINLKYYYELAENYYKVHGKSLEDFIDYLEILEKVGVDVEASKIQDVNAVRLMSIHAVKGLEFEKVIVTNLAEDKFPISRTSNEPLIPKELNPDIKIYLEKNGIQSDDTESIKAYEKATLILEERRLCYVAFTRAKKELILTYAKSYNNEENSANPSTFLNEINYKKNSEIEFVTDADEKATLFAPNSKFEQYKGLLKKQLIESLDIDDLKSVLSRVLIYHSVREGKTENYDVDLNSLVDKKELETHITNYHKKKSGLTFDKTNFTFSPTALLTYDDCPKKYELQHIFHMPERGAFGWSGASTGSFVHEVFEIGVKELYSSKQQFIEKAKEMSLTSEWKGVDLKDVNQLIDVFWERHKGRYNEKTLTEKDVAIEINGYKFYGIVDRIDFLKDGTVEIIDYKTNKDTISPKKRAWQLGFYAVGVKKKYGWNVSKLTLEMLRLDKPLETEVMANGEVKAGRSKGFNINDVETELVETANKIVHNYEHEFLPTNEEDNCKYCGYKFYCPKCEEK